MQASISIMSFTSFSHGVMVVIASAGIPSLSTSYSYSPSVKRRHDAVKFPVPATQQEVKSESESHRHIRGGVCARHPYQGLF